MNNHNDEPSQPSSSQPSSSQLPSSQLPSSQPASTQTNTTTEIEKERLQREYHKTKFYNWINNDYDKLLASKNEQKKKKSGKENTDKTSHSTKSIIDRVKAQKIKDYLTGTIQKGHHDYDTLFNWWVGDKRYTLVERNDTLVLHQTKEDKKNKQNKKVNFKEPCLEVAIVEDFFDILYSVHSVQKGHNGMNKTFTHIAERYHGLPRIICDEFVRLCIICGLNLIQQSQNRIKVIRSDTFLERFQFDLVDMRHNPSKFCSNQYLLKKINSSKQTEILDRKYVWIAHVEDHFTKLHIIWAQETKTMEETADMFERYVLAYFGLSTILHTDNGQEFKNKYLRHLINAWDGDRKHKSGRARKL